MSYLDEISGGGYYLNAFNNLLKRRQMETAAQNPMQNPMQAPMQSPMQNQMMGGRNDGSGSRNPGWDSMSNTQKAAYYSDNPTMAAVTQFGQQALNYAPYGVGALMKAQQSMFPNFVAEQQAIAKGFPSAEAYSGSRNFGKESSLPEGGVVSPGMLAPAKPDNFLASLLSSILPSSNVSLTPAPVESREATPVGFSSPTANFGKESSIPTAGVNSGAFLSRDQRIEQAARDAISRQSSAEGVAAANISGYGGGENSFGGGSRSFGEGQYNQGGMVNAQHLMGRAPAPDDGYGALQGGEYVITKAAVERYGKAMMDAINNGTFR